MKRFFFGAVILGFMCSVNPGRADEASTNVLFIGNSYTYYHSMPRMFRAMAEHHLPGHQISTKFVGHGGATLQQHWEEGRVLKEIRSGGWDYVVLQEQSMLGEEIIENGKSYVRHPDQFFEYSGKFQQAIQENDIETVFFMTWSRKGYPHQQKYLTYAYMEIARETGSKIAPAGLVWEKLQTENLFDLYEKDGSHPTVYGSYATALMLFSVIFNTDSRGVPGRLEGNEILRDGKISGEKSVLCDLESREVNVIQSAVSDLFKQMEKGNGYLSAEEAVSNKKPAVITLIFRYLSDAKNQFVILIIIAGGILVLKVGAVLLNNGKQAKTE
ncbi:MAG: hypothetical protein WD604_11405 [Balneolaceae bacterium]